MAAPAVLERLSQAKDPKDGLWKELGNIDHLVHPFGNNVLVAIYIQTEKDKRTGLYRPPSAMKEDVYQGTVGMVVMIGPTAFTSINSGSPKVGDWVMFRPGDGKRIQLNGVDCRWLEDLDIDGTIDDPEIITYRN